MRKMSTSARSKVIMMFEFDGDIVMQANPATFPAVASPKAQEHLQEVESDGYTSSRGAFQSGKVVECLARVNEHLKTEKDQATLIPVPYNDMGGQAELILSLQGKDCTCLKALFCSKHLNDNEFEGVDIRGGYES